jgi:ATP-dependent DNA ligase
MRSMGRSSCCQYAAWNPTGHRAWKTVARRSLEGFVGKDPVSTYRAGPARSWIKVKLRHERVFVVGGIRNVDAFDAVLIGEKVDGELRYRGVVEWGFKARDVLRLMRDARIFAQSTSPFADLRTMRNAVWMEPRLLAEVSYAELIDGRLRAPSWRGLVYDEYSVRRQDKRTSREIRPSPKPFHPSAGSLLARRTISGAGSCRARNTSNGRVFKRCYVE